METLLYLYFLVMLITWISLSSCVCKTARRLNRDGDVWFLFSLFFSPILGAIMVHCLGAIKKEEIEKPAWPSDEEKLMKKNEKTLEELEYERIQREADERIAERKRQKAKSLT